MQISVVIGFRNRDRERVRHALDALQAQTYRDFELVFIDYGSDKGIGEETAQLVSSYSFARYYYSVTRGWFWNRAHALNTGLFLAKGKIILFSDIDLVLEKDFLQKTAGLDFSSSFYTFTCFYLPKNFNLNTKNINVDGTHYEQNYVGLCAADRESLLRINGFDEYFMVWGAEDDDLYKRLAETGPERVQVGPPDFLVFHIWHPSQAPRKPGPWYFTMVDRLFSNHVYKSENVKRGRLLTVEERPLLACSENNSVPEAAIKVQFWEEYKHLFFNPLIKQIYNLEQGGVACVQYTLKQPPSGPSFFPGLVKLRRSETEAPVEMTERDIMDFLEYFIGTHREKIADYYFRSRDGVFFFIFSMGGQV